MRQLIAVLFVVASLVVFSTPAEAHGIAYKLTHMRLVRKAAKVLGTPMYVAGFVYEGAAEFIALPFQAGSNDFQSLPFVSW